MTNILIVAELEGGALRKLTGSAVTFAKQVATAKNGAFDILVIGEGATAASADAKKLGARKVFVTDIEGGYIAEKYAPTVVSIAGNYNIVTATASTYGKDLLPRVAARLGAGVASDISAVRTEDLAYKRAMYAGNVNGWMKINSPIHVVTVRQTEFEAALASGGDSPSETLVAVASPLAARTTFMGLEVQKRERPELSEADIVIAGGRALKSAENFKTVLEPFVDLLGAAMGASRAACDAGYVPNELQVGQTGKVVAPKVYFAVGISGAIQHLAGMKGSKKVVVINNKKDEPIGQVADYYLVADLFQAVPELTTKIKSAKG